MPTILELAELSKVVYESKSTIENYLLLGRQGKTITKKVNDKEEVLFETLGEWSLVKTEMSPSNTALAVSDFQGALFKKHNEYVFAFRGTESAQDLVTDGKLGIGMATGQFACAAAFMKMNPIPGAGRVTLCGHSLGGAIAQTIGNREKLRFATFNAPGVGVFSKNLDQMAISFCSPAAYLRIGMSLTSP
ncbi:MAG: hypothetical protein O3A00_00645 [Planctomycetota bacterium]|nr:hypothetical protein [Planctomycetota bacterium]